MKAKLVVGRGRGQGAFPSLWWRRANSRPCRWGMAVHREPPGSRHHWVTQSSLQGAARGEGAAST